LGVACLRYDENYLNNNTNCQTAPILNGFFEAA
jgi:hypothetical protein